MEPNLAASVHFPGLLFWAPYEYWLPKPQKFSSWSTGSRELKSNTFSLHSHRACPSLEGELSSPVHMESYESFRETMIWAKH